MARPVQDQVGQRNRCAIYTRKSTEEGLEQDFNSLHAQREACGAYVLSQRHEGWTLVPDIYDDGGYSGGNMERPALKALLAEIAAGKIDTIIVYKVDRLTRSLADFAKIVEVLDAAGASFVSVTQSFNTTTSMGRLTLNVLLSFAQFEREVTGERIRDKVAASKAKGMWMGGLVPLGYRLEDRKLLIDEKDAETVRLIFSRYLELGSGRALLTELDHAEVRSKARINRHGRAYGAKRICRGTLYAMLQNPIYIGQIVHKGQRYSGQHSGVVKPQLFEQVQAKLQAARVERRLASNAQELSLLAGLLVDGLGRRMSPSHTVRHNKRYRYYVSHTDGSDAAEPAWRVSAPDVETLVISLLIEQVRASHSESMARSENCSDRIAAMQIETEGRCADLQAVGSLARKAILAQARKIVIDEQALRIELLDTEASEIARSIEFVRTTNRVQIVVPPADTMASSLPNPALVKLVIQSLTVREQLESGRDLDQIAAENKLSREYLIDLVRVGFMAPSIITAIIEGRQPAKLTRQKLSTAPGVMLGWKEQREMFGFA